jgi:DNA-binding MarR family transcriptional regulator
VSTDTSRETPVEHDVPWLSPDQQRDWRALITLLMTLPPALDAQLKRDAGVNAFEYQVLAALSEAPGHTLVLSNLAALAQGSLSRLSHAITRLERSGWVKRRNCAQRGGRRTAETTGHASRKRNDDRTHLEQTPSSVGRSSTGVVTPARCR